MFVVAEHIQVMQLLLFKQRWVNGRTKSVVYKKVNA